MSALLTTSVFADTGAVILFTFQSFIIACIFMGWGNACLASSSVILTIFLISFWALITFWHFWIGFIAFEFIFWIRFAVSTGGLSISIASFVTICALFTLIGGNVAFIGMLVYWWSRFAENVASAVKMVSLTWLSNDASLVNWVTDPSS